MNFYLIISIIFSTGVENVYGLEGPRVAPFASLVKPVIGGRISFLCHSLAGSPPFQVLWFKDGKELQDSSSIRIRSNEEPSTLAIDSIQSSHSGNYTCRISNRHGSDSYTTELLVEGPPNWIEKPHNIKTKIYQTIKIKCLVSGYPKPEITWKKLQGSSWIQYEFNGQHNSNLQIMNATKAHEGRYGCSATNGIEPDLWSEFDISIEGNFQIFYSNKLEKIGAFCSEIFRAYLLHPDNIFPANLSK